MGRYLTGGTAAVRMLVVGICSILIGRMLTAATATPSLNSSSFDAMVVEGGAAATCNTNTDARTPNCTMKKSCIRPVNLLMDRMLNISTGKTQTVVKATQSGDSTLSVAMEEPISDINWRVESSRCTLPVSKETQWKPQMNYSCMHDLCTIYIVQNDNYIHYIVLKISTTHATLIGWLVARSTNACYNRCLELWLLYKQAVCSSYRWKFVWRSQRKEWHLYIIMHSEWEPPYR